MSLSITLEIPDAIPDVLHETQEQFKRDAKMAMAVKLYEIKKLPSGWAAQIAGLDRVSFLLKLSEYNVPIMDLDFEELSQDVKNA